MSTVAGTTVEPAPRAPMHSRGMEFEELDLVQRIRAEFFEMPGLNLTPKQAARVFGLDGNHAARLMDTLIGRGVLICDSQGVYRRAGTGERGVQRPCIVCHG